jgi:tripartite-type tricarboxylate transporter receptor subunit TctC
LYTSKFIGRQHDKATRWFVACTLWSGCRSTIVSDAADHADLAVPAGRIDRHHRARDRRRDARTARPARAAPDGHTIDIGQWDTHVGNIIFPLNYDLEKDFTPIGMMTVNPQVFIARKGFPADDLKGVVAWLKANPGKATLVEQTAAAKIAGIQMMQMTGTQVVFIPFKGAGPAMQAMLGGQVDFMILQAAAALPQARSGNVKILANLSPQRSKVIPDLPTSDEAGIPGLYAAGWFGLFGPRGLSKEVVAKLNGAMVAALADPKVQARLGELGLDLATREQQTPEGFARFHKGETDKWWPVIKAAGIKVE